jgi:uncharacterized protein
MTRVPTSVPTTRGLSRTSRASLLALRVYQAFFSALMPSACKFYPSCSRYASDAIRIHGTRHGSWLALRRLSRCHPFSPGGVDLVPDAPGPTPDQEADGQTAMVENTDHTNARDEALS